MFKLPKFKLPKFKMPSVFTMPPIQKVEEVEKPKVDPVEELRRRHERGVRRAIEDAHAKTMELGSVVVPRLPMLPYLPPPGICPDSVISRIAQDSAWKNLSEDGSFYSAAVSSAVGVPSITNSIIGVGGCGFPGFAYLTELTQITEYRDMSERTAAEMTRKWIKLKTIGDEDRGTIIKDIEAELKRFGIRKLFRRAAELDNEMGRAQIYIDVDGAEGEELKKPLFLLKYKIKKGSVKGFRIIEPITTYPADYNSINPLAASYYKPSSWFVYGTEVHASRLLTFISRPLPDLLKPVYNFSGISLSQLAQPYVDYWLSTRDSVGRLLRNFSITHLSTNLDAMLTTGGQDLVKRVMLFTKYRDNQGVMILNKNTEELGQINAPLSGLSDLQAQAQEHMAAVAKTPLVILLGITPKGLNTTNEGDLRIYYDYVNDQQEAIFRENLETVIKVIQLNKWGEIYEDITFDFVSLYALTEKEVSELNKQKADTDVELINAGVIDPSESRTRVGNDPDSGFTNLDLDKVITPPNQEDGGEEGGVTDAEADPNDPVESIMQNAAAQAEDGGFRGNQFIGGVADKDHPIATAMQLSQAAHQASRNARKLGTLRAHKAADAAHSRALQAHERAVSSAFSSVRPVHEAYIEAHKASRDIHRGAMGAGLDS